MQKYMKCKSNELQMDIKTISKEIEMYIKRKSTEMQIYLKYIYKKNANVYKYEFK